MTVYNVKFFDLVEQTVEEFNYNDLLDALTVIKKTNLNGMPAIPNGEFEAKLLILLTTGIIQGGRKTVQHPEGEYRLQLTKSERPNGKESVINAVETNLRFIPSQKNSQETAYDSHECIPCGFPHIKAYPNCKGKLRFVSPVAESGMSHEWDAQFINGDQNPETD